MYSPPAPRSSLRILQAWPPRYLYGRPAKNPGKSVQNCCNFLQSTRKSVAQFPAKSCKVYSKLCKFPAKLEAGRKNPPDSVPQATPILSVRETFEVGSNPNTLIGLECLFIANDSTKNSYEYEECENLGVKLAFQHLQEHELRTTVAHRIRPNENIRGYESFAVRDVHSANNMSRSFEFQEIP